MGARGRREWGVSFDLVGSREVAGLVEVARSAGEVMWYPADAASGNLLSPQASGFEVTPASATDAGLVALPDGTVARSVVSSVAVRLGSAHGLYEMVPVREGEPVTVGAWSVGGQWFRGFWRDALGSQVTNWNAPSQSWAGWAWHEATLTPPPGAAFLELHLAGGSQYALPSISWGDTAAREIGSGCPKAVVHSPEFSPIAAHKRLNRSRITYSVTEVG